MEQICNPRISVCQHDQNEDNLNKYIIISSINIRSIYKNITNRNVLIDRLDKELSDIILI